MDNSQNPVKYSRKTLALIETAKELFFRHGVRRITIEEICRKAGVSKMTFYRNFSSKSEIVRIIIAQIYDEASVMLDDIMKSSMSFEEKIQKVLSVKLEYTRSYSPEFIEEFAGSPDNDEIASYINSLNEEYYNKVRDFISAAKESGEINPELSTDFIMYMMNALGEMFKDSNVRSLFADTEQLIREFFSFFYYGVLSRKNE